MGLCRICALCAADVGSTPMRGSRTPTAKMVPKTQNAHRDAVVINDPISQHSTYSQCPLRRQHHRAPHPLCLHSHVCTRSPPGPPPRGACAARREDASRPDATPRNAFLGAFAEAKGITHSRKMISCARASPLCSWHGRNGRE